MAKILIPTPLRQFADKKDSVDLAGSTVGEVLKSLTGQYAELRRHLYNDEGKLRSFVNVYVNDEDIRYLSKEATPLERWRHGVDRPEHCRRIGWCGCPAGAARYVVEGRDPALQPPLDHARSRHGGAVEVEGS